MENPSCFPMPPLAMHRHDHPRVIIALSGGTMNLVPAGWPDGTARLGDRQSLLASLPIRPEPCTPTSTPATNRLK